MGPLPLAFYAPQISSASDGPPLVLPGSGSTEKVEPVAAFAAPTAKAFRAFSRGYPRRIAFVAGAWGLCLSRFMRRKYLEAVMARLSCCRAAVPFIG